MSTVQEGCLDGTEGVLCNQCKEGFNRDGVTCQKCQASSFGLRLSLLIIAGLIVLWLVAVCRHHLKRKWHRFKPLWRDLLRIISINVTFAQINSSLPAVIDVSWPPNFIAFVAKFNIVNIDLMSVLGTNCIGNFSFILSFIFMTMMPISIAVIGLIEYLLAHRLMVRRLSLMTDERKKKKEQEALHLLFKIADSDNSGVIDPAEMMSLLQQLGWRGLNLDHSVEISRKVGATLDQRGKYVLTEHCFVQAMISGKMRDALHSLSDSDIPTSHLVRSLLNTVLGGKPSTGERISNAEILHNKNANATCENKTSFRSTQKIETLDGNEETGRTAKDTARKELANKLVRWALTRQTMANSFSGATQLLLFAHTPVSRKVFQWFHCREMAGRSYLRADYRIRCQSEE
jgi:hypothetical protein